MKLDQTTKQLTDNQLKDTLPTITYSTVTSTNDDLLSYDNQSVNQNIRIVPMFNSGALEEDSPAR